MKTGGWTVVGIIIAIVIAYYAFQSPSGSATQTSSTPTQQGLSQQPKETASLENQKQCATDGAAFFQTWLKNDLPSGWTYYDPEYHFSTKLNTCLAYVGDVSSDPYNVGTTHTNIIYSIYSNTPIIQSDIYRVCSGTASGCTETLEQPIDSSVPNLGTNDFFAQKAVIMSQ